MPVFIALDIGGTKLAVVTGDDQGAMLRRAQGSTPVNLEQGLELLHDMTAQAAAGEEILGMGAAIGGPLDWRSGVVSPLHQPAWREVPLREIFQARWRCPFWVDVDTNLAALGEYHASGESASRFLYLTLSTGMGGGFLVDGSVYRGAGGEHPEVGHQSIPFRCAHPERVSCECGAPDCLEALVSGNGIRRIYGKPASRLNEQEWGEVAYNLGLGLRNLAAIYLPQVIVLGGGVALGGGERLLGAAQRVMAARLKIVPAPRLRLTRLGGDTALIGALWAARHGL